MPFNKTLGRFAARAAAGLVAVAALASCGGGTYQVNKFTPARILNFGDEGNILEGTQALKYSINGISTTTQQVDCTLLPLWNQVLAAAYNMAFVNCNSQSLTDATAVIHATLNADVQATSDQVDTFLASDAFNPDDLVTIWVGSHDVLNDYVTSSGEDNQDTLIADMHTRGQTLAALVNRIANAGAKVLVLTIADMGLSPYATNENALHGDFDRAALLTNMSDAFNRSLRANVINDGSKIGLVLVDDYVKSAVRSPSSYGLVSDPQVQQGCQNIAPLPTCTENTLNTDQGTGSNGEAIWLWADDTHLGAAAQSNIGNQAVSRAQSNPF